MKNKFSILMLALGVIITLTSMSSTGNSIENQLAGIEVVDSNEKKMTVTIENKTMELVCVGNWCCSTTGGYCCNLNCDFGRCCFPIITATEEAQETQAQTIDDAVPLDSNN